MRAAATFAFCGFNKRGFVARSSFGLSLSHLASNLAQFHPRYVGVRPFGGRPGLYVLDVVGQIHFVQFIVQKLSNIPGKIVIFVITLCGVGHPWLTPTPPQ